MVTALPGNNLICKCMPEYMQHYGYILAYTKCLTCFKQCNGPASARVIAARQSSMLTDKHNQLKMFTVKGRLGASTMIARESVNGKDPFCLVSSTTCYSIVAEPTRLYFEHMMSIALCKLTLKESVTMAEAESVLSTTA